MLRKFLKVVRKEIKPTQSNHIEKNAEMIESSILLA